MKPDATYKKRFRKISRYYNNLLEDFQPDQIHDFRLEMKKLRAFIRLVNLSLPNHEKKITGPIKTFYNETGNIRNLQLHQKRILTLCDQLLLAKPRTYLRQLLNEEKAMRKKSRQTAQSISWKALQGKLKRAAPTRLDRNTGENFVAGSRLRLKEMLTLPFFYDETLHEVRKILKDLLFNWSYVKPFALIDLPSPWNDKNSIKEMSSRLGDFHDLCVAMYLISPVYSDSIRDDQEREVIKNLRLQLGVRKSRLKREIIMSLVPIKSQMDTDTIPVPLYAVL